MIIKLVSLNTLHGGILQDEMVSFLEAQHADLVLLQEAHNGEDPALEPRFRNMQVLGERLGLPHSNFAPAYRVLEEADGKVQSGNALFSRFPIISSNIFPFIPYSDEYHNVPGNYQNSPYVMQHVVLDTPVGKINVFNIHGVWDLDGENFSPIRQKMSQIVIAAVKGKKNVIVAGDTNARPLNKAIIAIEEHLTSVFGHELKSTFNMKRKDNPGYATAAVDMMFVGPDVQVLAHDCPQVDISDHLPIRATFRIGTNDDLESQ